jgi:hypothetical protein
MATMPGAEVVLLVLIATMVSSLLSILRRERQWRAAGRPLFVKLGLALVLGAVTWLAAGAGITARSNRG